MGESYFEPRMRPNLGAALDGVLKSCLYILIYIYISHSTLGVSPTAQLSSTSVENAEETSIGQPFTTPAPP